MDEAFIRSAMLLGEAAIERLGGAHVAVFGLGGVGGHAVEALCRSGVGALTLVDYDRVAASNLNRQIYALHSTLGLLKAEVAARRCLDINPACRVTALPLRFGAHCAEDLDFSAFDYVVDAVDTVSAKLLLAELCHKAGTPLIAAMGAGNKLRAEGFAVRDLFETRDDPLARVMRKELRKRGIARLKVVCSNEMPLPPLPLIDEGGRRKKTPGSLAHVPSAAGLLLAAEVLRDLTRGG